MTHKKTAAILLAGGHGSRMQSAVPKQFLELGGHTVFWHSLRAFSESKEIGEIVLVTLPGETESLFRTCREDYGFSKVSAVVEGGAERPDSVYAGLQALKTHGIELVAIHDAARPFVQSVLIQRMMQAGAAYGAAVPALPVKDTIKVAGEDGFVQKTPSRRTLFAAQTPQVFSYPEICAAYAAYRRKMETGAAQLATDDAEVMELFGSLRVHLVEGEEQNQKLTTPEDFRWAEQWLQERHDKS
mgnify:FL=1